MLYYKHSKAYLYHTNHLNTLPWLHTGALHFHSHIIYLPQSYYNIIVLHIITLITILTPTITQTECVLHTYYFTKYLYTFILIMHWINTSSLDLSASNKIILCYSHTYMWVNEICLFVLLPTYISITRTPQNHVILLYIVLKQYLKLLFVINSVMYAQSCIACPQKRIITINLYYRFPGCRSCVNKKKSSFYKKNIIYLTVKCKFKGNPISVFNYNYALHKKMLHKCNKIEDACCCSIFLQNNVCHGYRVMQRATILYEISDSMPKLRKVCVFKFSDCRFSVMIRNTVGCPTIGSTFTSHCEILGTSWPRCEYVISLALHQRCYMGFVDVIMCVGIFYLTLKYVTLCKSVNYCYIIQKSKCNCSNRCIMTYFHIVIICMDYLGTIHTTHNTTQILINYLMHCTYSNVLSKLGYLFQNIIKYILFMNRTYSMISNYSKIR